jgi:Na+/melibiose symporter-like transporter
MSDGVKNTNKIAWLYFVAITAQIVGTTIAGAFLVYYITEQMLITTIIMSSLMFAARLADIVLGLVAGVVIQKFKPKSGQYSTWLLAGPIVVAIGTTICFINPAIPIPVKAVMVFIGYVFYGGGMSFIQLSQNGMLAKIAGPDMKVRMQISGKIVQGMDAGRIIASATMIPFIMLLQSKGVDGYTFAQIVFALVGVIGQLCLFFGVRQYERLPAVALVDPAAGSAGNPPSIAPGIGSMLVDTLKNGQLRILFVADSLRQAAYLTIMTLGAYYFNLIAKNPNMMTLALTLQSVLGLALAFVLAPLARKMGKKTSALITGVLTTSAYVLLAFFARNSATFYIVFTIAAYASQLIINSCGVNLYLDCGEYQLFKDGKDNRTFTMSIYGMGIKIGFLLSSVFVGLILSGGGYDGAEITNPGRMVMLIGIVPAALNLLYTALMSAYGITEEKSKEYAEANFKKAQATA